MTGSHTGSALRLLSRSLREPLLGVMEAYSWSVCEYESEDGCDGFWEGV